MALYKCIFTIAYYGMFRIGELTQSNHTVKAKDIHIGQNKNKVLFILHSLKTHTPGDKPQLIKIKAVAGSLISSINSLICPFSHLRLYLNLRPEGYHSVDENFFIFHDRSPIIPCQFRSMLNKCLSGAGIDAALYGSHSFRIGRSCNLFNKGVSIETIRKLGRWSSKSTAIYTYLKNTSDLIIYFQMMSELRKMCG